MSLGPFPCLTALNHTVRISALEAQFRCGRVPLGNASLTTTLKSLGLNDDELAFYDALAVNDSAVQIMGIDELKVLAAELVTSVRRSATVDWTVRELARALIRVIVRRILRKYGYPPDLQAEATRLVLEQAEVLCADWAG